MHKITDYPNSITRRMVVIMNKKSYLEYISTFVIIELGNFPIKLNSVEYWVDNKFINSSSMYYEHDRYIYAPLPSIMNYPDGNYVEIIIDLDFKPENCYLGKIDKY